MTMRLYEVKITNQGCLGQQLILTIIRAYESRLKLVTLHITAQLMEKNTG